jgi:spermidine synthase
MGTGITAGAALFHPLERVTVCELIPEVAAAARKYFSAYSNGLFSDPRARIVLTDARNYLLGTRQRFDVIISDLFVPWHAGTTNLYSREHFAAVRDRLNDGGLFALWLPLYQLSEAEFAIIARTMLEVFPSVTMWRGDFLPATPVVALVGHDSPTILNLATVVTSVRMRAGGAEYREETAKAMMLLFYAGNLTEARGLFESSPINTDDRPEIEYSAPVTQRRVHGGESDWLTGNRLVRFYAQLAATAPPDDDPFLAASSATELGYTRAGRHLYESSVARFAGENDAARSEYEAFSRLVPGDVEERFRSLTGRE